MCTDIKLVANNGDIVIGRSMEFEIQLNDYLSSFPRNQEYIMHDQDGKQTLQWTSLYSFVGIHANIPLLSAENGLYDAVNEVGLTVSALLLSNLADYGTPNPEIDKPIIPLYGLFLWIISTCKTVVEAKEKVLNSQVWVKEEIYLGYRKPEFHFSIHDRNGDSIVVQFVNNGDIHIYNNHLGVATNNPEYSWHVDNVKNYFTLDNHSISEKILSGVTYKALGQGNGFRGIPGDYSSPSRFVKMAYLVNYVAEWTKNSDDAIINAGSILANAEIPAGAVVSGILGIDLLPELTFWKALKDLKNNALYIKSYKSLGYVKFDLSQIWSGDKELHENVVNIISSNN